MRALAQRGETVLVALNGVEGDGVIVNVLTGSVSTPLPVQSILARGYWREFTGNPGPVLALAGNVTAAFTEAKVRRWPTGTRVEGRRGGGRFAPKDGSGGSNAGAKPTSASEQAVTTDRGDSEQKYRDEETGEWDRERVELHDGIQELFLRNGKPQAEPTALFMAGGSGSGKDFVLDNESLSPPDSVMVNPDLVKELLPEYREMVKAGDPDAGPFVHEESSYVAKEIARNAIAERSNMVVNGTGNGGVKGAFYAKIQAAEKAGYGIEVVLVDAPVEKALEMARAREQRTGRRVREGDLRAIHRHVAAQHLDWRDKVDNWKAYDNSGGKGEHTLMAYREGGGNIVVVDQARYDRFLKKGREGG